MQFNQKMARLNPRVGVGERIGLLDIRSLENGRRDDFAAICNWPCENIPSRLGFPAQEGKILHRETFMALGLVPARAFLQQAQIVRFEIAGNVQCLGPCVTHFLIMTQIKRSQSVQNFSTIDADFYAIVGRLLQSVEVS